jgi:hypothetical protein
MPGISASVDAQAGAPSSPVFRAFKTRDESQFLSLSFTLKLYGKSFQMQTNRAELRPGIV